MAKDIRVIMKQFNGVDYDNIYPNASNGVMAKIIVTPNVEFVNVKAIDSKGVAYDGIFKNSVWEIEINEFGNYLIDGIKSNGSKNSINIKVDVCKKYNVQLGSEKLLNEYTWAQIRKASDEGIAESLWAVGDAKQITINSTIGTVQYNNYQPWVYILGFNHNAEKEGNNRIHFGCFRSEQNYSSTNSIVLDDDEYFTVGATPMKFRINLTETNSGGWKSSHMRTQVLNANATSPSSAVANTFLKALPEDLKAVMKSCTKYTDNVGGGNDTASNVTATTDWVWLLSEWEIFGSRTYANSAEQNYQKQYQYYINGNSKVKYRQSNITEKATWWSRSCVNNRRNSFCLLMPEGGILYTNVRDSDGLAPVFCV